MNHHHKNRDEDDEMSSRSEYIKNLIRDILKQAFIVAAIFIIGIVAMNWSAYSIIIQDEWQNFWGTKQESPLEEFTETKKVTFNRTVLETSKDPQMQKKQIPPLDIEIAPLDNRIIIPRIDQNLPIMRVSSDNLIKRDWNALEKEMQQALQDGVVHYPGTSTPGQNGNMAITGHSSYFPWDPGRFKDVFALLHKVVIGDKIVIYWDQKKHVYEVNDIKVVLPQDISVLKQTPEEKLTLITCTPVGTNLKRLIISANPVDEMVDSKIAR